MGWLLLSILTALSESLKDVFSKNSLRQLDEYRVAFGLRFISFLFLIPIFFFLPIPELSVDFWWALLATSILNVATTVLYMKALKYSDMSLSVPFVTFTPLFLLLTSPIMVGEFPNLQGLAGVLLIVAGSYAMNVQRSQQSWWAPFKALLHQKGPRYMMGVAFIWSITANIDKVGVQGSSPYFWSMAASGGISLFILPLMVWKSGPVKGNWKTAVRPMVLIGLFSALTLIFQMSAIKLTLVAYVISIKRTSAVMAVIWGALLFRESNTRQRLVGAIIMVIGVVCISLS